MNDRERILTEAADALHAGEPTQAYETLRTIMRYPGDGLQDRSAFVRATMLLAQVAAGFGDEALSKRLAAVAAAPANPQALYEVGYGLYEAGQPAIAATFLLRANEIAPGQVNILVELATCLEALMRNGEAALFLDRSGVPEHDPVCAYLSGFHWLMAGDLERPRQRLAQLRGIDDGFIPDVRDALEGMLARADALQSAGITLHDRALTAWQAVLCGSLLLHESPYGYDDAMRGRYAYTSDSPQRMREGMERLAMLLEHIDRLPQRVVSAPDRASSILGQAMARRFGVPHEPWTDGSESEALVVVWSMEHVEDPAFASALFEHRRAQHLFVHASRWTEPFAYAPDTTTLLHQVITHPWTGGALVVDDAGNATHAQPDARSDEALAQELLATPLEEQSVTSRDQLLAIVRALERLPDAHRPGLLREHGRRLRQRAGGPVPSNRFD